MAEKVEKSGVQLVAEKFNEYVKKMRDINKAHKKAYDTKPLEEYQKATDLAAKKMQDASKAARNHSSFMARLGKDYTSAARDLGGISVKLNEVPKKFRTTETAGKKLSDAFGKMKGAGASLAAGLKGLTASLGPIAIAIGVVVTAINKLNRYKQWIEASTQLAIRNETLAVTFDVVAQRAGFSKKQAAFAVEGLKKAGITTSQATEQLQRMAQANLEWGKASKLARVAQDAAVISGFNSSEAFGAITIAIQRGSAMILDNFGIIVRFSEAYEDYAKTLGKSVTQLTDSEKLNARLNAVLKEGEKVAGTYEAAMKTAGKIQGSMARQVEETRVNIGDMILPIKTLIVETRYKLWKGLRVATEGLALFKAPMILIIEAIKRMTEGITVFLRNLFKLKEGTTIFDTVGKALQLMARGFAVIIVATQSVIRAVRKMAKEIATVITGVGKTFSELLAGNFKEAGIEAAKLGLSIGELGETIKTGFSDEMAAGMVALRERFPELFVAWNLLGVVAEVNMTKATAAIDSMVGKLTQLKDEMGVQIQIVEAAGAIWDDYNKGLEQVRRSTITALDRLQKGFDKGVLGAEKKRDSALTKLTEEGSLRRRKFIEDHNKRRVQREVATNKRIEQQRRAFQLRMMQAQRRFHVQERRLQAEGDVLALIRLREDNDLRITEANENRDATEGEQKKAATNTKNAEADAFNTRLKELDKQLSQRRTDILTSFDDEKTRLVESLKEQERAIQENHMKNMANLATNRNQRLRELGKSLQDEELLTKEGMEKVAEQIGNVFGDQGAAQLLMEGWADDSKTITEQAVAAIREEIASLEHDLLKLSEQRSAILRGEAPSTPQQRARDRRFGTRGGKSVGARQGFEGTVTGPATFNVEPGVREAIVMSPMPASSNSQLDVNFNTLKAEGFERASSGSVDRALDTISEDMKEAIRRNRRRI